VSGDRVEEGEGEGIEVGGGKGFGRGSIGREKDLFRLLREEDKRRSVRGTCSY
jgi:hypothetical protein